MMDYADFKTGPASRVFAGLGGEWASLLERSHSFGGLRHAVVSRNNEAHGCFVMAVRAYAGKASQGEHSLLLAICVLVDFGHVADKLSELLLTWQNIVRGCDRETRAAIAACIEAAP
ncbi:MAG: hypothetical protein HZA66_18840 [Rhodopseudomonas palustris]|uniref:Uncharacterized protein n=1 Tax=Rhodopseudomonas palustris TaxID=1076 RepID=A0A933S0D5_RHOPL|nr:hypothetical protein [Rhodopseudomonas palustris]